MKGKIPLRKHLSSTARKWARSILDGWTLLSHKVKVLIACAEEYDHWTTARQRHEKDGAYFLDRWGCPRSHPAVADERNAKIAFARLLRELNLSEEPEDPRPPALRY